MVLSPGSLISDNSQSKNTSFGPGPVNSVVLCGLYRLQFHFIANYGGTYFSCQLYDNRKVPGF
jgi:hypothetical protein